METTGLDGWWEAFQLDKAVSWFGRYVENKLNETDSRGRSRYTLDEILGTDASNAQKGLAELGAAFGVINNG
jgi:hypothetical protein